MSSEFEAEALVPSKSVATIWKALEDSYAPAVDNSTVAKNPELPIPFSCPVIITQLIVESPREDADIYSPAAVWLVISITASTKYSSPETLGLVCPLWSANNVTVCANQNTSLNVGNLSLTLKE